MRSSLVTLAVLFLAATAIAQTATSLPAGTGVKMKLETTLSTMTSKAGDNFAGRVTEPVTLNGKTVIPVGAAIQGRVTKVSEPRRIAGSPEIVLRPERITMPNGDEYNFSAVVVDTNKSSNTTVTDEGKIHGPGHTGRDTAEIAGGAGAGTVVGALAGGAKGAFIGGAIGATITAGHWMTKRHSAVLPAGSEITLELTRPMAMSTVTAGQ
jgi:hypothetical protein